MSFLEQKELKCSVECDNCKIATYCNSKCQLAHLRATHCPADATVITQCKLIPHLLELVGLGKRKFSLQRFEGIKEFKAMD